MYDKVRALQNIDIEENVIYVNRSNLGETPESKVVGRTMKSQRLWGGIGLDFTFRPEENADISMSSNTVYGVKGMVLTKPEGHWPNTITVQSTSACKAPPE